MLSALIAAPAAAVSLDFSAPVRDVARQSEALSSYAMPVGPFADGRLPTRMAEGALSQESFQLDAPGRTTLEILAPLRAQLAAQGYRTVFECEAFGCGGFDFRFGTRVMPEPDMHVDLGDFRFLAAVRDEEVLSLIVSRSSLAGFVQLTRVTPAKEAPQVATLSSKSSVAPADPLPQAQPAAAPSAFATLELGQTVVLDGLDFAPGAASLGEGSGAVLAGLAAWLAANPGAQVYLLGYTDASGPLAANVALSRERAEAVRAALISDHGISPERIRADGLGPENPRADNATPEGRRANRRVEVSLTSTPVAP